MQSRNLSCVAFTPDGRFAISGHSSGAGVEHIPPFDLLLWDLSTGKVISDEKHYRFAGQFEVNCLAVSPDSKRVVCGRKDGTIHVLEIATGKEILCITPQKGSIHSIAFSSDGASVLFGEETGSVFLWRIRETREINQLGAHKGAVYCVGFSPSGQQALSGGADKTAKLWDVQTGKELATYQDLSARSLRCRFQPRRQVSVPGGRVWETEKMGSAEVADKKAIRSVNISLREHGFPSRRARRVREVVGHLAPRDDSSRGA